MLVEPTRNRAEEAAGLYRPQKIDLKQLLEIYLLLCSPSVSGGGGVSSPAMHYLVDLPVSGMEVLMQPNK